MASTAWATMGRPSIGASSLFAWPMRRDCPAASTSAATLPGCAGFASRGCGRVGISISRPPTPMPMMSCRVTGMPAARRPSTQSKPFSLGERAQPGRPRTVRSPRCASSSRLPGSTGMPKCSTVPPAASIAAGSTSRRSVIAEAPAISRRSPPLARMRSASAVISWAERASLISRPPAAAMRSAVTATVLSSTDSLVPGRRVWISATSSGRYGATRTSGPPSRAIARQRSIAACGAANGMILMVATIWPDRTLENAGKVPSVTASSTRLSRSMRARSTTTTPACSACRFTRPVKGLSTRRFGPATASATSRAASSSSTSPGSSLAAITVLAPAARSAETSSADSRRPFFRARRSSLTECARIAPSALSRGIAPNFMDQGPGRAVADLMKVGLADGGVKCGSAAPLSRLRPGAAAGSSRPAPRSRSRPG